MIRKAWAVWKGGIQDGGGAISAETRVLLGPGLCGPVGREQMAGTEETGCPIND